MALYVYNVASRIFILLQWNLFNLAIANIMFHSRNSQSQIEESNVLKYSFELNCNWNSFFFVAFLRKLIKNTIRVCFYLVLEVDEELLVDVEINSLPSINCFCGFVRSSSCKINFSSLWLIKEFLFNLVF